MKYIQNSNVLVLNIRNNKIINGSCFYAFEYFLYIKKYVTKNCFFVLIGAEISYNTIIECFIDKYKSFDINNIINIKSVLALYSINDSNLIIVLDEYTYTNINYIVTEHEILLYQNIIPAKKTIKTTTFGWYPYQTPCDIKTRLRIGFEFQKTSNKKLQSKLVYISSPHINQNTYYDQNVLVKPENQFIPELMFKIGVVVYNHNGLDKNNRIIPESKYHDIELIYNEMSDISDSATDRYLHIEDTETLLSISNDCLIIKGVTQWTNNTQK